MAKITKIWTDVVEVAFAKNEELPKINTILYSKETGSHLMVKKNREWLWIICSFNFNYETTLCWARLAKY